MKIALLGTRGIPANYGGFETFAEELSTRLVDRGHSVTVYCREPYKGPRYRGVDLVYLPPVRNKYAETLAHTFASTLHLLRHQQEVALYCNAANALFTTLPRLAGIPVALNVDGIERKRRKWGAAAKAWYLVSEWLSTVCPNRMISDAENIAEYYRQRYGKNSIFIPYGAETGTVHTTDALERLGLIPKQYFLYVSRFEPENNAILVRKSFEQVACTMKLALIGDAPYAAEYVAAVKDTRDPRIIIPGAIYGQGYKELQSHCFTYIHATEVGGTHPALIEAMGRGALTLYLSTPENEEVAGSAGLSFTPETLASRIRQVLDMSEEERNDYRARAAQRVRERYSWDAVTDQYEQLLAALCAGRR